MNLRAFGEILAGAIVGWLLDYILEHIALRYIHILEEPRGFIIHGDDLLCYAILLLLYWKAPFKRVWATAFGVSIALKINDMRTRGWIPAP